MARDGQVAEPARIRPEVFGLAVLGASAVATWSLLLACCASLPSHELRRLGQLPWSELTFFGLSAAVGVWAIENFGLLGLARRARADGLPAPASPWSCWFAHFKLSFAALVLALVAGFLARQTIVLWLAEPLSSRSPHSLLLYYASPLHAWKTQLVALLGVVWLPVVPFFASDVSRLLLPLTPVRAAWLRWAFPLATGLAALAPALLLRHWVSSLFGFFLSPAVL